MPGIFGGFGCKQEQYEALKKSFNSIWGECESLSLPNGFIGGHAFSNQESLAEGAALMGYYIVLAADITFPDGTTFPSGYIDSGGAVVQPPAASSGLTLAAGSVLVGGAILPDGDGDTLSADIVLNLNGTTIPGSIRIDDTTTSTYKMRAPGLNAVANTYIANGANIPSSLAKSPVPEYNAPRVRCERNRQCLRPFRERVRGPR